MRIGALVSDFLPTPALPCHSPHAGGIIWASLCFKNTSNQSEEVIGSRMEGHVTRHRFHASLRVYSRKLGHTLLFARSVKSGFHEITSG